MISSFDRSPPWGGSYPLPPRPIYPGISPVPDLEDQVWSKGATVPGRDPSDWRRDAYGSLIRYSDHGNKESESGWEMDHYPTPKALGGSDTIDNLRPLNFRTNASLGGQLGAMLRALRDML